MKMTDGIAIWGEHEQATIEQIKRCAADEHVVGAALLSDEHLGYAMPIGGVIAYREAISPNGVGFDISCGNKAAKTGVRADDIRADIGRLMDEIARTVVFGIGRTSGQNTEHRLFDSPTWDDVPQLGKLKAQAREQLGTVGSGNHYVGAIRSVETNSLR